MNVFRLLLAATIAALPLACGAPDSRVDGGVNLEATEALFSFQQIESEAVPRLMRLSEDIYCGAEPKLEASFAALQALGVRTVISVDGANPKLEMAARHGLSYVHIPIGYDGISAEQAAAMVAVVRTKAGPYFFHCHHGRHRGPAAAAIAYMAQSGRGPDGGLAVLELAGISYKYSGLWRDIRAFVEPDADATLPELQEKAVVSDFNASMAQMDRVFDELKLIQSAGWLSSAEHPDLDPHQSALIMAQRFEDLGEPADQDIADEDIFRVELERGLKASLKLERALRSGQASQADELFREVRDSCRACHTEYRNT